MTYVANKQVKGKYMSSEQLLDSFLLVSRCWNDEKLALKHNMSFSKASRILKDVSAGARRVGQKLLAKRADKLLHDIIYKQEDNAEVDTEVEVGK